MKAHPLAKFKMNDSIIALDIIYVSKSFKTYIISKAD